MAFYTLRFLSTEAAQRSSHLENLPATHTSHGNHNNHDHNNHYDNHDDNHPSTAAASSYHQRASHLSIGSRLLLRVVKCCQHVCSSLATASRDLELGTILARANNNHGGVNDRENHTDYTDNNALGRRGGGGNGSSGRGGDSGITSSSSVHFQRMIDLRRAAEAMYWGGLDATLMLYSGSESPLPSRGRRANTPASAFPSLCGLFLSDTTTHR